MPPKYWVRNPLALKTSASRALLFFSRDTARPAPPQFSIDPLTESLEQNCKHHLIWTTQSPYIMIWNAYCRTEEPYLHDNTSNIGKFSTSE